MLTVQQIHTIMENLMKQGHNNTKIAFEGFNDQGDFMQLNIRGDVRMERDAVGAPLIVIR